MSRISETIDVNAPLPAVYDQWTQFESFPSFMEGVESVIQIDDRTLEWRASIAGKTKHWTAEIVEQRPDALVSWRSTSGARNDGAVTFVRLGERKTRVQLDLDVETEGGVETIGDALGFVERRVKGDLERFKTFIEERGVPTGAWRGAIEGGQVDPDPEGVRRR